VTRTHLLFDLDQTLMASNSAGGTALRRAFDTVPGAGEAFAGLNYQGRTDLWIVRSVAERSGIGEATLMTAYRESYPALLREELHARNARALPGVVPLLERLHELPEVVLGLGTGNWRDMAFVKLGHVELDRYFETGGFGDRHDNRPDMLREGIAALGWQPGERLVVIGDSEHDMTGATEVDAIGIGVATGDWTEAQLAAAGADSTLPDLADLERTLTTLLA